MNVELVEKLGRDVCVRNRCFPVSKNNEVWIVATQNALDELLREALELKTGDQVKLIPVQVENLENEIQRIATGGNGMHEDSYFSDLIRSELDISEASSLEEVRKKSQAEPVIKLVHNLINQAVTESATDIHIEPSESLVKVRYRKDGMLEDSLELPKWVQASLTSCLKIMSELDISEKRLPQDGRIKWPFENEVIDLRVSSLPTRLGEKVVLRILKHVEYVATLDSVGMPPGALNSVRRMIHRPQGMIFVTGPTGSGKSSTLYASLREIIHKDINISTIEDPVEYRLEGANQVQVNEKAGLTFAGALRSLLRQDPDVILVGEIRDEETAAIAVQAAQTGHLVFSTLHTNDSASAVTRLLDLQIKPFLIASSVLGIMAQRLVRKTCPKCLVMEPPSDEQKNLLPQLPDLCPVGKGCDHCNGTGYRGRTGIFELLTFDTETRQAILDGKGEETIRRHSVYKSMLEDGLDKLNQKTTSASELIRVALTDTNFKS